MWQILKAELSYNRFYLGLSYIGTLALWLLYLVDASGLVQLFGLPVLFLALTLYTRGAKEKRERLHGILPVTAKQCGLAGWMLYVALFYIFILSGWAMQGLRERDNLANEYITFSGALTLIGLALGIIALLSINADLKYHAQHKYRRLTAPLLLCALPLYISVKFFLLQNPATYDRVRDLFFYTPAIAGAANIAAAGLVYLSVVIHSGSRSCLR